MNSGTESGRTIELWAGVAAAALLGAGCLLILRPFISAALWAAILCFTTWPMFLRLDAALGGRRALGAFIATLALAAIIAAPVVILGATLASNISALTSAAQRLAHQGPPKLPGWVADIPLVGSQFASHWNELSESSSARIAALVKWLPAAKEFVLGSGRAVGKGIFQIVLSLLIAFFSIATERPPPSACAPPSTGSPAQTENSFWRWWARRCDPSCTAFSGPRCCRAYWARWGSLSPESRELHFLDLSLSSYRRFPPVRCSSPHRLRSGCIARKRLDGPFS